MSSPKFQRELLRLANRDHLTADLIQYLVDYGEFLGGTDIEPSELYEIWKESLDEP